MRGSTAGLPDTFSDSTTTYYALITVLDLLFSAAVVCPCVVGYWRSVWTLMDIYVGPDGSLSSALISTAIGIGGHMVFGFYQGALKSRLHPKKGRVLYYVASRLYTICFAVVCVNGWRGPWMLLTIHTSTQAWAVVATTLVGVLALASMRTLRNVSSPPCVMNYDGADDYFDVLTMFRVPMGEKTSLYILDCLFSVLVVGTLVVFVWRGAWIILDLYLFPDDFVGSSWSSLILGYALVAVAFLLQPLMRYFCEVLSGAPRLLVADFFILFSLFGTVNVWRGIWNLLDIYLLPSNLELSCWITHWVSLVLLILLGCSNSLLVRGVYIDAEEPAGKCVVFPCHYLRIIFQEEKLKKMNTKKEQDVEKGERLEKIVENNHVVDISIIESRKG